MNTAEKFIAEYNGRKNAFDIEARQWMRAHQEEYDAFRLKMISGDMDTLEKMQKLAQRCMPSEAKTYFRRLSLWATGKMELEDLFTQEPGLDDEAQKLYDRQAWKDATPEFRSIIADTLAECKEPLTEEERQETFEATATMFMAFQLHSVNFVKGMLETMRTKAIGKDKSMFYKMYCFTMFDGGLRQMMGVLSGLLCNPFTDTLSRSMARSWIPNIVQLSVLMGIENKGKWMECAEKSDPDVWKEIVYSLRTITTPKRHKAATTLIDDLCSAELQAKIREFLSENHSAICLAYLLKALVDAGKVNPRTKYKTFHRTIEQLTGEKWSLKTPQQRYGYILEIGLKNPPSKSLKRAKEIIDKWTPIFADC